MSTPTTPSNPNPNLKVPLTVIPASGGPRDVSIPSGKTVVLVNDSNVVTMCKSFIYATRIFTSWTINVYPDMPTALADITAKGWKYTAPASAPAPAPASPANASTTASAPAQAPTPPTTPNA